MATRVIASAIAIGLAVLAVLAGLGFLLASLYSVLTGVVPVWAAALILAAVCFLGAAIVLVVLRLSLGPQNHRETGFLSGGATNQAFGAEVALGIGRAGAEHIRDNPKASAMIALLAGAAVGASPSLRQQLVDLVHKFRE